MTAKNTGGPAFPCDDLMERDAKGGYKGNPVGSAGMTLRDYFAASAKPSDELGRAWGEIMVRPYPKDETGRDAPWGREAILWWADVNATWRFVEADAMLKARGIEP